MTVVDVVSRHFFPAQTTFLIFGFSLDKSLDKSIADKDHFFYFQPGQERLNSKKIWGKSGFWALSVWTLADCEWRAAAPGLKPLRLPRARNSLAGVAVS